MVCCIYIYNFGITYSSIKFITQTGYKEREDRITELEEFINDQVTELDKMETAMKQAVANKEIAEKELIVRVNIVIFVSTHVTTLFTVGIVGSFREETRRINCTANCL